MISTAWAQETTPEVSQATETITTEPASDKKTDTNNPGKAASAKKNTTSDSKPVNLETAYKREYAFLDAQKRELKAFPRRKMLQATRTARERKMTRRAKQGR